MTTIIIGDDHPMVRAALASALTRHMPDVAIIECPTLDAVLAAVESQTETGGEPDLVLLDLNMPGTHGFAGLFLMQAQHPTVPVAIVSGVEDPATIHRALGYGASGYLPKSLPMAMIAEAVDAIMNGEVWAPPGLTRQASEDDDQEMARRFATLSAQQIRVLMMLVEGRLNKQIAYELGVSEQTIKVHVSTILRKLNVISRTQAAVIAHKLMVDAPPSP